MEPADASEGGAAGCMRSLHAATWGPDGVPIRNPYAVRVLWMRGLPSYGIDGCPYEVEGGGDLGLGLFCWGILPIVPSAAGGLS
jgi:hypothetical protein